MGSVGNKKNTGTSEEQFKYTKSPDVKDWSEAEQKRTDETGKMVNKYLYAGGEYGEYYEQDGEDVYTDEIGEEYGAREGTEVVISKEWFIYNRNWDENDNRVKKGKKVPGTIYYTVSINGEVLDENVGGYKTLADAKHALELELDYIKQREAWYKNRRK